MQSMFPTTSFVPSFSVVCGVLRNSAGNVVLHRRNFMKITNEHDKKLHLVSSSVAIGTLAGLLGSLAGMGGGFIMIPLMTSSLLRLSQHVAHGTSLFAVTATGIAGAIGYGLNDIVEVDSAMTLAAAAMITARLGASYSSKISEKALKKSLGLFMILVAPIAPAKSYYLPEKYGQEDRKVDFTPTTNTVMGKRISNNQWFNQSNSDSIKRLLPFAAIGIGSGFASGLFGVGGGAIVVPALTISTDMTHHEALGTSLLAMALPAMVGTYTHYQKGNVALRVALPLSMGAFIGAFVGSKIGINISEDKLRFGFAGLVALLGVRTLMKT